MTLSVVIPCFNEAQLLPVQLRALTVQRAPEPWEIVVADNGSNDGSQEVVEELRRDFPSLRLVDASDRRGAAHARNVGARAACGEKLAFVDADDMVGEGWVAAMSAALDRHDFVCCRFEAERLNPPWVLKIHRCPQQEGPQQYSHPPYLSHAGGGGLGVRRVVHEAVGGFDEDLQALEDTDYCWRIQRRGIALAFAPDAVVHIRYPQDLRAIYEQARSYAIHNVLLYKRYRALGMPRLSWRPGLQALARLPRQWLQARDRSARARFVWQLGWHLGRLEGSLRHRVYAL